MIWPALLSLEDPEPCWFQTHHPNNQGITQSTALPQTPEQPWHTLAVPSPRVSSHTSTKSRETEQTWEKCSTQMGIQLIKYWARVHGRSTRENSTQTLWIQLGNLLGCISSNTSSISLHVNFCLNHHSYFNHLVTQLDQ